MDRYIRTVSYLRKEDITYRLQQDLPSVEVTMPLSVAWGPDVLVGMWKGLELVLLPARANYLM